MGRKERAELNANNDRCRYCGWEFFGKIEIYENCPKCEKSVK